MRTMLSILLGILLLTAYPSPAGDISIVSSDSSFVDVTAVFNKTEKHPDVLNRIAEHFYREFDLKAKKKAYDIALITDDQGDTAENNSGMYIIEVELVSSGWKIDKQLGIPYILHRYANNYRIEAVVKIYKRGETETKVKKRYRVKAGGPQVVRFIDTDPHAGGLMISYVNQVELEEKAERDLAKKLSKDLHKTIMKYGGF